ncbi:MAG: 6,7-dimethyl-8-ribityllumazine synthase [Flavobacteriales bacterium]|nr:6,7-dimethyl-8-ribityllumazine synthase [Flavobacteriales bacterium]
MATQGHNLSAYDAEALKGCRAFRIGVAVSEWNSEITHALRDGALAVLKEAGVQDILIEAVPGSFELPLASQWMLRHASCDAVIAIGSVIRGETAHFDFVCQSTAQGTLRAGMDADRPVIFCVLTDDNIAQSRARAGGEHGNKGVEAAVAALKMAKLRQRLSTDGNWGIGL